MRSAKKFGLAALVGGATAYAFDRRRRQGGATGSSAGATQRGSDAQRPTQPSPEDVQTEYHADGDELAARRSEQADQFVDVTADAAPLVAAERDALTVPGGDGEAHRRRDQTAGEAAQEIAAAQVRERRNGEAGVVDDFEE